MKKRYLIAMSVGVLLSGTHSAMGASGDVGLGVKAGTLGVGVEVSYGFTDDLVMRGGFNYLNFDFDVKLSEIDYKMEPDFKNLTLLLDWHPFSGAFRLTGGFSLNDNTVGVDGTVSKDAIPAQYSQHAYLTDLVHIKGDVDFNSFAPYVGLGWTSGYGESGWGVSCDFGMLFQGAATVSELDVVTGINYGGYQNEVTDYLDRQEQEIQDELDKYEYYPVASIMLNYVF